MGDAFDALAAHLAARPESPVPHGLRVALLAQLGSGRRARDRAIRALAAQLDPEGGMGPWEAAGRVGRYLDAFDRAQRLRRGLRAPRDAVEAAALAVCRSGCEALGRRTLYRALTTACQADRGDMGVVTFTEPRP